ncbi:hypothetical protein [Marilutibacter aestuarii]|uniref:Tetratricopeptide repeat protein n=1 Tax=Marilutibacter aestuarii TaxID=1706195 RepID=A0A508AE19_9GAMM|nr:hypothetical protein [Lysobacter aestuarii]TQD45305.1 hypothetical protein FKV25_08510 [Lysobacter aestuarii]
MDGKRRMFPFCLNAALALLLSACPPVVAANKVDKASTDLVPQSLSPGSALEQRIDRARALAAGDEGDAADRALTAILADPGFDTLPTQTQGTTLSLACWVAAGQQRLEAARAHCERAVAFSPGDRWDWYRLAMLESYLDQPEAAARHFVELVQRWPETLDEIEESDIHRLRFALPADAPERLALAQALFDANWRSPFGGDSGVWYDLALARVERGEQERARQALRRVSGPSDLVRIRSDRRFDGLFNRNAASLDVENAARLMVERLQRAADVAPDSVQAQVQLTYGLLMTNRHDETAAVATRVLERLAQAPKDRFDDADQATWLLNNRAMALSHLGRDAEAEADMQRAIGMDEAGQANVSQRLNLGDYYCSLERPDDAERAVDGVGAVSGYGAMVLRKVQHCVAMQRGDDAAAGRALAYLRAHEADAFDQLLEALLRDARLDEAAALVRRHLADASLRGDMLAWLQGYADAPVLPGNAGRESSRATLLDRDDVRAAIEAVGRVERYAFTPSPDFG